MPPLPRKEPPDCFRRHNYHGRPAGSSHPGCSDSPSDAFSSSCEYNQTVTLTQTSFYSIATSTASLATTAAISITAEPEVGSRTVDQSDLTPSSSKTGRQTSSGLLVQLPTSITSTTLTSIAPTTTKTLILVNATAAPSPTASVSPNPEDSGSDSATIAGSVIGSMASLVLITILLFWCLRRKRKWNATCKCKAQEPDREQALKELASVRQETAVADRSIPRSNHLPDQCSFNFGSLGGNEERNDDCTREMHVMI